MVWKSIGAVLAGFVFNAVVTTIIDVILHKVQVFPPMDQSMNDTQGLIATSYRVVLGILGCYITARLAPHSPMKHALAQGGLGVVLCVAAAVATWNNPTMGPHWYPIALAIIALPCAWLGGWIYVKK
jgi:hypothetical protein